MTSTTVIGDRTVHVDSEGFLADPAEWDEALAHRLGALIGVDLGERHLVALRAMRGGYFEDGESPTVRKISALAGIPIKELFGLFPNKPAKKMAYIAGVPKPRGCV
jgi:TusE/DsrC/DsvC family sulfur relay protein